MIKIIIQARFSSQRLPGKILADINGKPLIEYVIDRVMKVNGHDGLIIATSKDESDEILYEYCRKNKITCHRGPLENVAARFKDVIENEEMDAFVRVSGDSPMLDIFLLEQAINIYKQGDYDIVTNVLCRTFPKGQSVEIINKKLFLHEFDNIKDAYCQEHVTPYFYNIHNKFKIYNITAEDDYSHMQLSVDTTEDMGTFKKICALMTKEHWRYSWQEALELYKCQETNNA